MDGHIVGSANAIQNGSTAWLSHIIVAAPFRGQGIGRKLTEFILYMMLKRGNRTILLIATAMGEKIYTKIGFRSTGSYDFYAGTLSSLAVSADIREATTNDLKGILSLDKKMSGEERSAMIRLHLKNALLFRRAFGRIEGFYLPGLGEGMIVASRPQAGIQLLSLHLSHKPAKIVVPSENSVARDYLISLGFKKFKAAARMCYGDEVKWRPTMLFNRIGGWYG